MNRTSVRWIAVVGAVIVILTFALGGTAYAPVGSAPVRVVDGTDVSHAAAVDSDGNLQVTGNLGITGTPTVDLSGTASVQLVPTEPVFARGIDGVDGGAFAAAALFDVPEGKRVVVELVTVRVDANPGADVICWVLNSGQEQYIPLVDQGDDFNGYKGLVGALEGPIYLAEGAGGVIQCQRDNSSGGPWGLISTGSGYLVNA